MWRTNFIGVVAALLAAAPVLAQTGTITGTVTDATGGSVAGASVTATNAGTGAVMKAATNTTGSYQLVELTPGMYSVTVEAPGFSKVTIAAQRLVVASNLRLDVTLQIGQVSESVTVDELAPQVNTHPSVVRAVAEVFRSWDAREVFVAEGQGHCRDSDLVLEQSGLVTRTGPGHRSPVHLEAEVFDLMTAWIELSWTTDSGGFGLSRKSTSPRKGELFVTCALYGHLC